MLPRHGLRAARLHKPHYDLEVGPQGRYRYLWPCTGSPRPCDGLSSVAPRAVHRIMKTKLKKNLGASSAPALAREGRAPRLRPGLDGGWTDDSPEAPVAANVEQLDAI
eukprot:scaffold22069_cov122-Isochrysis_galbana.AAC.11